MDNNFRPIIVTTDDALARICTLIESESLIAFDTEFVREKTYYPILCLVQIATSKEVIFIDPLINDLDMTPLWQALMRSDLIKIIHGGRQDIEIVFKATGKIPPHIFDTQVAVQFLGIEETLSYENLVKLYLNKVIDKSAQRSNWIKRPLTANQIRYAATDVYLLRQIYFILNDKLTELNRVGWLQQEMATMYDPNMYLPNFNRIFKQLNLHERYFNERQIQQIYALMYAREQLAQQNNISRQSIMTSEQIKSIGKLPEVTLQAIMSTCTHMSSQEQAALLDVYFTHLGSPAIDLSISAFEKARNDEVINYLQLCLKTIALKYQLSTSLITNNLNLAQFTEYSSAANPLSKGWRYEIIGNLIKKILASQAGLFIDHDKLTVK